ncbi:MAG: hypothetical protein OIF50_04225, partial [Flavobacteriaceae bacterium]|nr:hypothetical protein [Flavobacteriaceae bacterium]
CYSVTEHNIIMKFDEIFKYKSYITKENNVIFNCETHLQAFSLPKATPKWQFDLAGLGTWLYDKKEERPYEIDKFIGVWENQLLVSCFSGLIIALDIATGQLLHQWSAYDAPSVMGAYSESHINPSFCCELDAANNTLVGFSRFTMWHIDLSTGQLGTVNLAKAFEKENILTIKRTSGFVLTSSHYIITAETNDIADVDCRLDCLIAIHKETHNIDWIHPFSDS